MTRAASPNGSGPRCSGAGGCRSGRRHRLELLQQFLAPWPTEALDLEQAADQAAGWSPAQIKAMVGEAAGRALARSGRGTPITQASATIGWRSSTASTCAG